MKEKISRFETKIRIEEFFSALEGRGSVDVKRIKKLAMKHRIPLGIYRRRFCSKCLMPFSGEEKVRIKNGFKSIWCSHCEAVKKIKLRV